MNACAGDPLFGVYPKKIGGEFVYPIKKMNGKWVWPQSPTVPAQSNLPPTDATISSLQSRLSPLDDAGGLASLISPPVRNFRAQKTRSKTRLDNGIPSLPPQSEVTDTDLASTKLDVHVSPPKMQSAKVGLRSEIGQVETAKSKRNDDGCVEAGSGAMSPSSKINGTNPWSTPSDATEADLEAVSAFLYQQLEATSTDLDKTIDDYQDLACVAFGQAFDGTEWDDWFDDEMEVLSEKLEQVNSMGPFSDDSTQSWATPSDASEADIEALSAFLYQQMASAGTDLNKTLDDYQDLAFEAFDQVFNSDEWDDWFDNEIKVLSKKLESVKQPNILSHSNIDTSNDECTTAAQDHKHMTNSEVNSDEDINYKDAVASSSERSIDRNDDVVEAENQDAALVPKIDGDIHKEDISTSSCKPIADTHVAGPRVHHNIVTDNVRVPATHTSFSWTATANRTHVPASHTPFSWGFVCADNNKKYKMEYNPKFDDAEHDQKANDDSSFLTADRTDAGAIPSKSINTGDPLNLTRTDSIVRQRVRQSLATTEPNQLRKYLGVLH